MTETLRWTVRDDRLRLALGLAAAVALALALPANPSLRLLVAGAALPFAAWMVLGRDVRRRRDGTRRALQLAPRGGRAVALSWIPGLVVVAAWAAVGANLELAAVPLFAWGAVWLLLADGLDRRCARGGVAWVVVFAAALAFFTAPVWMGLWFGRTELAPTLASWTIGAHPVAMALDASGHTVLQDENFYAWTLSGVLEVRPLGWVRALPLYAGLALALAAFALASARRDTDE